MNKFGKAIDQKLIGKLDLIIDMIEQVQQDYERELNAHQKDDLKKASNLIFGHANTDGEYF